MCLLTLASPHLTGQVVNHSSSLNTSLLQPLVCKCNFVILELEGTHTHTHAHITMASEVLLEVVSVEGKLWLFCVTVELCGHNRIQSGMK